MSSDDASIHEAIRLQILEIQRLRPASTAAFRNDDDFAIAEWTKQLEELSTSVTETSQRVVTRKRARSLGDDKVSPDRKANRSSINIKTDQKDLRASTRVVKTEQAEIITDPIISLGDNDGDDDDDDEVTIVKSRRFECCACMEPVDRELIVQANCNCQYCKKCFKAALKASTTTKNIATCCGQVLQATGNQTWLGVKTVNDFEDTQLERSTANALYCADPTCSTFVKPTTIVDGFGKCSKCKLSVCEQCKQLESAHLGRNKACPPGTEDAILGGLIKEHGFKRCPHCQNVVEKNGGCNSIRCKCGKLFCYVCGQGLKTERGICGCTVQPRTGGPARTKPVAPPYSPRPASGRLYGNSERDLFGVPWSARRTTRRYGYMTRQQ